MHPPGSSTRILPKPHFDLLLPLPSKRSQYHDHLLAMATYDSLHRQCRTLEALFDTKLTAYARLASSITRSQDDVEAGGSTERWKDLENEVDELLEKVRPLVCRARA